MVNILTHIKKLPGILLNLLIPASKELRTLEKISAHEFTLKVKRKSVELDDIFSIFDYRDPLVKQLIWQIKFKGQKQLTRLVAELVHEHLLAELAELELFEGFEEPLLVPVPLSKNRLKERGFNQVNVIAEQIIKIDVGENITLCDAVSKIKETPSQARTVNRATRLKNIEGSFEIKDKKSIENRNIIVLDDVVTTGSTLTEMRKILLKAGARRVIGFAFAH